MRPWNFLQDPFYNAIVKRGYIVGLNMSIYHDSSLAANKSDPFILALYNTYHPIHLNFFNQYNLWYTHAGSKEGETLNLSQLLSELGQTKIQDWDISIQKVYRQSTPAYKKLLPNRRGPFQSGKQTERMSAVKSLSTAIGTDAALADVKTSVDAFYTQLESALSSQRGSLSSSKDLTVDLDAAMEAMCIAQYADLGGLIQKYAATPEKVAQYFDLKTIRQGDQTFFTGTLNPGEIYTVVKHTFMETGQVYLSNKGDSRLRFYLAATKGEQPGTTFVELGKGEQTVDAKTLGAISHTLVTVMNTDPHLPGKYEIEIL